LPPRGGKGHTGRAPTPGRSTGQDRLAAPNRPACRILPRRRERDRRREGETHLQQHEVLGSPARRRERWHRSDGTSQPCRGRVRSGQKVPPPPTLLQNLHRDGRKVPPAQGRVGIAGGSLPPGHLAEALPPQWVPARGPPPTSSPWMGAGRPLSVPAVGHGSGARHSRHRRCCASGRRPCQDSGGTEGVPGRGGPHACATVGAAEFRSRRLSSPLGGGDAEAKPPAVWTRAGGGGRDRGEATHRAGDHRVLAGPGTRGTRDGLAAPTLLCARCTAGPPVSSHPAHLAGAEKPLGGWVPTPGQAPVRTSPLREPIQGLPQDGPAPIGRTPEHPRGGPAASRLCQSRETEARRQRAELETQTAPSPNPDYLPPSKPLASSHPAHPPAPGGPRA